MSDHRRRVAIMEECRVATAIETSSIVAVVEMGSEIGLTTGIGIEESSDGEAEVPMIAVAGLERAISRDGRGCRIVRGICIAGEDKGEW